jgi:hypothetical protein
MARRISRSGSRSAKRATGRAVSGKAKHAAGKRQASAVTTSSRASRLMPRRSLAKRVEAGSRRLLDAFAKAKASSIDLQRPVSIRVTVPPHGRPKIEHEMPAAPPQQAEKTRERSKLDRALDAARKRGRDRIPEILSRPDMLGADEFAKLLGTNRMTVNTWRHKHRVLALDGATRGFRFPNWQIGEDGKPFHVLPALFKMFAGSAWAVYRFLVQHHPELGGVTAQEALRRGKSDQVMETAESVAHSAFG